MAPRPIWKAPCLRLLVGVWLALLTFSAVLKFYAAQEVVTMDDAMRNDEEELNLDEILAGTTIDSDHGEQAAHEEAARKDDEPNGDPLDNSVPHEDDSRSNKTDTEELVEPQQQAQSLSLPPSQSGPFIDILGDVLLSLKMVDETHAQVQTHFTNEVLAGKKVVGLYFSADWCGPCRQFTPDLVAFYEKINARRGKHDEFEIVWISRCRSIDDFGQYFTQMKWLALPPQEAMGQRGQYLGEKYNVKSIPTLILLDEIGNVITTDARNKIPMDKAGIGFPWRNPISVLVATVLPRSFRLLVHHQVKGIIDLVKTIIWGKNSRGARLLGGVLAKLKEVLVTKVGDRR